MIRSIKGHDYSINDSFRENILPRDWNKIQTWVDLNLERVRKAFWSHCDLLFGIDSIISADLGRHILSIDFFTRFWNVIEVLNIEICAQKLN